MTESEGVPAREFLREIHDYVHTLSQSADDDGSTAIDVSDVISRLLGYVDGLAYVVEDLVDEVEGRG